MTLPCKTCRVTHQVASLIREATGDFKMDVGLGDKLMDDLQLSSIDIMYMLTLVEQDIHVTVPQVFIDNISRTTTVNDVVNLVIKLKEND